MNFHQDGTRPLYDQIFVFGSNLAAIHGAGAAQVARLYYGAQSDVPDGPAGKSYAIPTKGLEFECLSHEQIKVGVDKFVEYTKRHPELQFFVTRVGCGLAGNKDADIAPMFKGCGRNCSFPVEWQEYLLNNELY